MIYNLIVAICINRGIGYKNMIPWKVPEDMKMFSKVTKGDGNNAVVMGRKTWESLSFRPLKKRDNLILSKTLPPIHKTIESTSGCQKVISFKSISDLVKYANNYDTVWIIGGSTIYEQFLKENLISQIHISYINQNFTCDTFFPKLDDSWIVKETEEYDTYKKEILIQKSD